MNNKIAKERSNILRNENLRAEIQWLEGHIIKLSPGKWWDGPLDPHRLRFMTPSNAFIRSRDRNNVEAMRSAGSLENGTLSSINSHRRQRRPGVGEKRLTLL